MTQFNKLGTSIPNSALMQIDEIHTISPVKYDGITMEFKVCAQEHATHMAILSGSTITIDPLVCIISLTEENKGMLSDLL